MPNKAFISPATSLEGGGQDPKEVLGLHGFSRKSLAEETDHRPQGQPDMLLERLADREQIATALAGNLVRRLFEVELWLESALTLAEDPEACRRVRAALAGIDDSIRCLREAIFDLSPTSNTTTTSYALGEATLKTARGQASPPGALTDREDMWPRDQ